MSNNNYNFSTSEYLMFYDQFYRLLSILLDINQEEINSTIIKKINEITPGTYTVPSNKLNIKNRHGLEIANFLSFEDYHASPGVSSDNTTTLVPTINSSKYIIVFSE